ncbi:Sensor histidine kinase [hydrothermal vent metagenome]|uniref:Sensor histidine kinase n=1 Tax=hydrothermal vent metagenome TaxID=652676 RepID=A0A3B1C1E5_9ZZZZ
MRVDSKIITVFVVVVVGLVVGAYMVGRMGGDTETAQPPAEVAQKMAPVVSGNSTPKTAMAPPQQDATRGKTPVDSTKKSVHFRVGNRNVKDLYADGDLVWVGFSGGVIRYDIKTGDYRLFDTRSGLLSNGVFHVGLLDGKVTVGTYGGGLSLYNAKTGKWDNLNIPDGLGDAFVYDILTASNGDVWVATWSGANRIKGGAIYDPANWELFTVENTKGGLPNDWVYSLAEGKNGEIWLATEGGLARFVDGEWKSWQHEHGLGADFEAVKDQIQYKNDPGKVSSHHAKQKLEQGIQGVDVAYNPNYIVSLLVDRRDGTVWAGTWGGGLARFDGTTWKNYTVSEGLPGNHVFMLYQDPDDTIWAGTSNGLARIDGDGKFKIFKKEDGLFANNVFSMVIASDGSAWVGSFGGVARIKAGILK